MPLRENRHENDLGFFLLHLACFSFHNDLAGPRSEDALNFAQVTFHCSLDVCHRLGLGEARSNCILDMIGVPVEPLDQYMNLPWLKAMAGLSKPELRFIPRYAVPSSFLKKPTGFLVGKHCIAVAALQ